MFKQRILKILAVMMVLNILIIPLTSFLPQEQNKYTVHASGDLVDIRFFNAMVAMIGITSAGVLYMSQSFSIPEVDMVALKDQFQATLDADATKKTAWMNAQTKYLAGGVAQTMGAVELAKIGINDVYIQLKTYLNSHFSVNNAVSSVNLESYTYVTRIDNVEMHRLIHSATAYNYYINAVAHNGENRFNLVNPLNKVVANFYGDPLYNEQIITYRFYNTITNKWFDNYYELRSFNQDIRIIEKIETWDITNHERYIMAILAGITVQNIEFPDYWDGSTTLIDNDCIVGNITYTNNDQIINTTTDTLSIIPTIPWIDTTVPIGTVVTPAISAPYAGAVPIDVPISVPIDPPIDEPVDPPAEPTLIGTVAAILAALVPISGLLDNIDVGIDGLAGTITEGIDSVIDGIGDITGTLTGGITAGITGVVTGITDLTNSLTDTVAEQTVNLDPIKNIPSVIFTKFPFCIPWDFAKIIAFMNDSAREPPDINLVIPFSNSLSFLGIGDFTFDLDFSMFDTPASFIRMAELIVFSLLVMFKTKTLIWG